MPRAPLRFVYFLYLLTFLYFVSACNKPPQTKITIGSKFFTEQVILAELLAQHIETRTSIPVDRKTNLGGTLLVHKALQAACRRGWFCGRRGCWCGFRCAGRGARRG